MDTAGVAVAGGEGSSFPYELRSVEIFWLKKGTWTLAPSDMPVSSVAAVALEAGTDRRKVTLVVGEGREVVEVEAGPGAWSWAGRRTLGGDDHARRRAFVAVRVPDKWCK